MVDKVVGVFVGIFAIKAASLWHTGCFPSIVQHVTCLFQIKRSLSFNKPAFLPAPCPW
jgi:hypothetical protein